MARAPAQRTIATHNKQARVGSSKRTRKDKPATKLSGAKRKGLSKKKLEQAKKDHRRKKQRQYEKARKPCSRPRLPAGGA